MYLAYLLYKVLEFYYIYSINKMIILSKSFYNNKKISYSLEKRTTYHYK